jgi:hypothetical protein
MIMKIEPGSIVRRLFPCSPGYLLIICHVEEDHYSCVFYDTDLVKNYVGIFKITEDTSVILPDEEDMIVRLTIQ